jgi:hypothetical protein
MIKDLTIVSIDSLNYNATALALDKTREMFPDAKIVTISDKDFYPDADWYEVPKFDSKIHSKICLHNVYDVVDTEWALFVQYDGFPTNPEFWTDDFLNYDYVGGIMWNRDGDPVVGCGGFSLRSKKMLDLSRYLEQDFTSTEFGWDWLEDQLISHTYRPWLESQGIKFATPEIANLWCREAPQGAPTSVGFHAHNLIPEYGGKELTLKWLNAIDDSTIYNKNLYCIPYYLWKWDELDFLREFMIKAEKINTGWSKMSWKESQWRIGTAYPEQDLWELQKMITVYGYVGP